MNLADFILLLILAFLGLVAGKTAIPGWANWALIFVICGAGYWVLLSSDPIVKMVGVCVLLLAGMKGLVYREWGGKLPWKRYLLYSVGWFGMDPGSFKQRRRGLSWKRDLGWGLLMMIVGALGGFVIWEMGWRQIFLMFLPMSIGFHFGALRVLKSIHRMAGFPVRTLFPNPLKTRSVADFWSRRWNVGYSQMMQRLVGRPVGDRIGKKSGVFSVFVVSGLLHEIAITVPVGSGFGLPTLYFVGHGILVLFEGIIGRPLGKMLALCAVVLPLGMLFPPEFQGEVIERSLSVFDYLK